MAGRSPMTRAATATWADLAAELDAWAGAGRTADLWWRDDDAAAPGPRLDRLIAAGGGAVLPALAVVPAPIDGPGDLPGLDDVLPPAVAVLQHGSRHARQSRADERKSEFPDSRPAGEAAAAIRTGQAALRRGLGHRLRTVFVPPWNRMAAATAAMLPCLGFTALSAAAGPPGRRRPPAPAGLVRLDCHADITAWNGTPMPPSHPDAVILGALVGWLAAMRHHPDLTAPLGILTHHKILDAAGARFLDRLIAATLDRPGCRWHDPTAAHRPAAAIMAEADMTGAVTAGAGT